MKISDLIEFLTKSKHEHGDVNVCLYKENARRDMYDSLLTNSDVWVSKKGQPIESKGKGDEYETVVRIG